jgi:hypothetical protein
VNPLSPELMFTRVWSALANPSIFFASCRESSADKPCRFDVVVDCILKPC